MRLQRVTELSVGTIIALLFAGCVGSAENKAPGTTASTEKTVSIEVVEAANPIVVVPDINGLQEDQAFDVLRDAGLVAKFSEAESSEREGTVILQTPRAGAEVEEGETIDVRIAIPLTRTIGVLFSVHDELWQNLEGGKCEHRGSSMFVGQSVTLLGPDGESLAVALVEDGYVSEKLGDPTKEACMFAFQFRNIPEVRSYGMRSATAIFPQVPVSKVIEFGWNISWSVDGPNEPVASSSQNSETAAAPATSEQSTSTPTSSSETVSQANARAEAASYLRYSNFSRQGLIDQIEFEGYSTEDATYGVDAQNADWFAQAVGEAESYLKYSSFSRSGLINQLEYEGFSQAEAVHGVDAQNADWFAQAALEAQSYLDYGSFSRQGLIDQLLYEGFSQAEAEYGVNAVGL